MKYELLFMSGKKATFTNVECLLNLPTRKTYIFYFEQSYKIRHVPKAIIKSIKKL